jgi:hypothetical protein
MSDAILTKKRLHAGVWEGVLTGMSGDPVLEVLHLEVALPDVSLAAIPDQPGAWAVRVPVPAALLSEGVQSFLIRDAVTGDKLGHFTIITGVAMEDDIRAEIDLLRAELDMLKRAFRRHCLETAG